MKPLPRIDIIKHRYFTGRKAEQNYVRRGIAYCEDYEVRVITPNRPLQSRNSLTRMAATLYARNKLEEFRKQGAYDSIVYDGRIVRL